MASSSTLEATEAWSLNNTTQNYVHTADGSA